LRVAGFDVSDKRIGVAGDGKHFGEETLLRVALAIEAGQGLGS
jgi:RNase H-fold protein (predicted Holliday junction resolvase)